MKTRGTISLVFDDGYQEVYDTVLPLLARYNIRGVFAVPLRVDMIAEQPIAPLTKWQQAAKKHGHEIAAHGITHTNMTTLSSSELTDELQKPAKEIPATTLVYPGGARDESVMNAAKKCYTAARSVIRGYETIPPKNAMALRTINFSKRNFSPLKANIHAMRAFLQDVWLIETYHMVSNSVSPLTHSALIDELEAHLDFISSLPVRIVPIQEVMSTL